MLLKASVARSYGAKQMVRRFGLPVLAEAVAKINYPGLDLSAVGWPPGAQAGA
jgi:hypothetical protein